jgi:hypothetical protein
MDALASMLYKTGPFGILVVFLFVMERRTRSLLVGHLKKPVGVAVYILNWVTILVLCVVTVVIWIKLNVPGKEATIKGRLIGLRPNESLASPFENLYLRRVYGSDTHSDYVWRIISNSPLPSGASVPLYVDRSLPGHEDVEIFELKIDTSFYTNDVSLTYDATRKNLLVTDADGGHTVRKLSQIMGRAEPSLLARLRTWLAGATVLLAQSSGTDSISSRLQADDPVVRLTARDELASRGTSAMTYIDEVLSDRQSSYRLRVGVIVALNKMSSGRDRLSRQAKCTIISATRDPDVLLSEQAAAFLTKEPSVRATECGVDAGGAARVPPATGAPATTTTIQASANAVGVLGVLRREAGQKGGGAVSGFYAVDPIANSESKARNGVPAHSLRCDPALSPTAQYLLFCTERLSKVIDKRSKTPPRESVYHWLDLKTGTDVGLDLGPIEASRFSFSSDGRRMAFQGYPRHVSTFATNLFTYNFDDKRVTQITHATEEDAFRTPVLSPLVRQMAAFEVFDHPATMASVVIVDESSGTAKRLVDFKSERDLNWIPSDLSWSPAGKTLAFIQGGALNVIQADGTGFRRIVQLPREGTSLYDTIRWSPRGDRIGFSHANKVYSVLPDGNDLQLITAGELMSWTTSTPPSAAPR